MRGKWGKLQTTMTTPSTKIQHYYINLDRSPDRRQRLEEQLIAYNLLAQRIPGIEGAKLGDKVEGIDPALYQRCHGRMIRPGEIGCYLSHLKALKTFLETDLPHAVIFEDDAIILPSYPATLAALTAEDMRPYWDMVKLQCRRAQKPWHLRPLGGDTYLGVTALRSTGATAYLVNRHAAKQMIAGLLPMQVPWDHAFDRALHLGIKVRAVHPYPVKYYLGENNASTIETAKAVKVMGIKRATTYLWRAQSETARIMAAISTIVAAKFR
jgi:glycosyl transferase family 25